MRVLTWRFSPDEFAHVWRETDIDVHPYPVRVLESPATEEQATALRRVLDSRLPLGHNPDLTLALSIIAAPHTRVVAIGGTAQPLSEIRVLGAAMRERAVLVAQEPGPTSDYGGAVRISLGHADKLGERVAARLPPTGPGREARKMAATEDLRTDSARTYTGDWNDSPTGRIRALLEQPRLGEGHIRVEPRLDRQFPPEPTHLSWIDVEGDGRYVIKPGTALEIIPADVERLATEIQLRIPRSW